jgi:hypothetical protein
MVWLLCCMGGRSYQVEMPEAVGCPFSLDDNVIVGVGYLDPRFSKYCCAVVVAKLANGDE